MQTELIHLHDEAGEILCTAGAHNQGTLLLSTRMSVMASCQACLVRLRQESWSPIDEAEYAALVQRARTSLTEMIEPLDDWVERQRILAERKFRWMLALDDLYRQTPWWALFTRHWIRQAILRLDNQA